MLVVIFLLGWSNTAISQNEITINASLDHKKGEIKIIQFLKYENKTGKILKQIYLNDWISSYSISNTPLAKKFLNEFNTNLYITKEKNRGFTSINSIIDVENNRLNFNRLEDQQDLILVKLNNILNPNEFVLLKLIYTLKIQDGNFTGYGKNKDGDYNLNTWYLTPAMFDKDWKMYSNLNFDKPYSPKCNVEVKIKVPLEYNVYSELEIINIKENIKTKEYSLKNKDVRYHDIFITKKKYKTYEFGLSKISILDLENDFDSITTNIYLNKINKYLTERLNFELKKKIIISNVDLLNNSVYGLSFVPALISPHSKDFDYEISLIKNIIKKYLDQIFLNDPREDLWLKNGYATILLMDYINTYYKDLKLIGKLADLWPISKYNFSKLEFNDQFRLIYQQILRTGKDQSLSTQKDNLSSFNERFTNHYKSAFAILYLNDFVGGDDSITWLRQTINENNGHIKSILDFKNYLKKSCDKNIDWFFDDFIKKNLTSDYKIKSVNKINDSLFLTVKNLKSGSYPFTISTTNTKNEISTKWINGFDGTKNIALVDNKTDFLILNINPNMFEYNLNNNWKSVEKFKLNKPLQIKLFQDIQNPNYNLLNVMPIVEFQNVYDSFKFGANLNNNNITAKPITFSVAPSYGIKSRTMTGNTKFIFNKYYDNKNLFNALIGITFERSSFDYGAFVTRFQPFAQFSFRQNENFRSNILKKLQFRYINIQRDESSNPIDENTIPPYQIFNTRYIYLNNNIDNYKNWYFGLQFSKNFGKINFSYEIRKRTSRDRHYGLRFFFGSFLYNSLSENETNFNYSLYRPINYLLDYDYLGQSESSGILSQQLIIAEGGFKSKIKPGFANHWISSLNLSASIWRYVQVFSDFGLVKNMDKKYFFAYGSGLKIDLIKDYFELYFPIYSNLGWEIIEKNYEQKIRFVFTSNFSKLGTLFSRRWF